jgi:hypothetical protein
MAKPRRTAWAPVIRQALQRSQSAVIASLSMMSTARFHQASRLTLTNLACTANGNAVVRTSSQRLLRATKTAVRSALHTRPRWPANPTPPPSQGTSGSAVSLNITIDTGLQRRHTSRHVGDNRGRAGKLLGVLAEHADRWKCR